VWLVLVLGIGIRVGLGIGIGIGVGMVRDIDMEGNPVKFISYLEP
jgi:hypothetical protein